MSYTKMGDFIKSLRLERGLSKTELADCADLSIPVLVRLEQNRSIGWRNIVKILDAMGLEMVLQVREIEEYRGADAD